LSLLNDIEIPWHLLTGDCHNKHDAIYFIDSFYTDIVTALQASFNNTVPKHKSDFYKYWWDQKLDLLKQESVNNHRIGLLWEDLVMVTVLKKCEKVS